MKPKGAADGLARNSLGEHRVAHRAAHATTHPAECAHDQHLKRVHVRAKAAMPMPVAA
jgi:hypothetical protein